MNQKQYGINNKLWYGVAIAWSLLLLLATWNQISVSAAGVFELAKREALASYNKDLVYRRWAAMHGGVYVPETEQTPANPYLAYIPDRDITTVDGKHLTLVNPAYMTRQVHALAELQYGVKGHITSLNPLQPLNKPDAWEEAQLRAIDAGKTPRWELSQVKGGEYLRILYPMITEERCLKCHVQQGYEVGDICGGMSVSVPMRQYNATHFENIKAISLANGIIWLLGLSAICWMRFYINKQFSAQNRLRELAEASQEKFQTLFSDAPYGAAVADLNSGEILACNQALLKMTGYNEDELIGQPQAKLHPVNREDRNFSASFVQQRCNPDGEKLITQILTKQGELRDVEIKTNQLQMDGRAVLHGYFNDITEQKAITDALRQSEEKFANVFANAPIMITISNLQDGRYLDANAKFYEVTGHSKEGLVGRTSLELGVITPETRSELIRILEHEGRVVGREMDLCRKDGTPRKCRYYGEIIAIAGEKRLLSLALDTTEQRELEERLQQGEKMQAIGLLAGGIAHDFNNQLSAVLGYAELMQLKTDNEQIKSYAGKIRTAAQRATGLTQQLLAFSRKKETLELPIKVEALINEVASILSHSIDKKITIHKIFAADRSTVLGDATPLQNALLNIAINARDSMPDGGELTFRTELSVLSEADCEMRPEELTPGPYLQLQISDTGSGISPEDLTKIFDPFFTTKKIGKGTGMGLASAYGTLRSHHGFIDVSSELGIGTTFSLYLPLLTDNSLAAPAPSVTPVLPHGQGKILLADDEEMVLQVCSIMLEELGYRVESFPDGEAAFDYYREHWNDIDLVILDMIMPKLNGLETFSAMKHLNPNIRCIIASGYSGEKQAEEILRQGVAAFMSKPIEHRELANTISRILQG